MSSSSESDPERLLSSALRAQAGGAQSGTAHPNGSRSGASISEGNAGAVTANRPPKGLPVVKVLVFALVLGLICGALAALVTLL